MRSASARAPGRVNLIGEHTDYNGGSVLPCAIANSTGAVFEPGDEPQLLVRTPLGRATFETGASAQPFGDWRDYVRGVIAELHGAGMQTGGGRLSVESTVPIGAGLSSSASFEVAVALALSHAAQLPVDGWELAQLAQRAENGYTGTNSGIMDQFAVVFGRAGHALLLSTRTLEWEAIPFPADAAVVICNSMQARELNAGEYNARRSECEQAAAVLREHFPAMRHLCDLLPGDLEHATSLLSPVLARRTRHAVTENQRVLQAAAALRAGDCAAFGVLMNESHRSLRDDFEVSSLYLDILVEAARDLGAYGARLTGAGFGGCTVNLVQSANARSFARALALRYHERTGISPEIYDGTPAAGASVTDG